MLESLMIGYRYFQFVPLLDRVFSLFHCLIERRVKDLRPNLLVLAFEDNDRNPRDFPLVQNEWWTFEKLKVLQSISGQIKIQVSVNKKNIQDFNKIKELQEF